MRVLVTGGSGLVGRRVVRLLSREHEVVNFDLKAPSEDVSAYIKGDILDLDAVRRAAAEARAVVHAAAIPGPKFGTADDIYLTNLEGTRSVAEAASLAGVKRLVNISSESVLGLVFGRGRVKPRYFPIDESHALSPSDPYGRSKLAAEEHLADARATDSVVVSLRPPWVWVPEEYATSRRLTHNPNEWAAGLWAYIHGDDLAAAVKLAVEREMAPGHYPLYVSASDNGTIFSTRELIERFYPQVTVRSGIGKYGSLISTTEAARLLGFSPELTWRGFLT